MVSTADPLSITPAALRVRRLGEPGILSPMAGLVQGRVSSPHYVHESDRVLLDDTIEGAAARLCEVTELPSLEPGGPREYIYFDPSRTRAAIVTCGGLCPGVNNVIRGLVLELVDNYGVTEVLGFRDGFRGLVGDVEPVRLSHDVVAGIHNRGGTVLGTSRGSQDPVLMVETLERLGVSLLFVIGGDGTLRGAAKIADEAGRRGFVLSVIGVPKTIDNDIPYLDQSFGFQTAFARATDSIKSAHTEASSTPHGVGLVKVMGRHSGFIACYAALASHDADFVLIPEVPFFLDGSGGFLARLRERVRRQGHAVAVVAEGAGQELLDSDGAVDASGNARLSDIGALLRHRIAEDFAAAGDELSLRYVDPGYAIRSVPANGWDAVYCLRLAQAAVHAAMAGRTAMVVGRWHGRFVHLPIPVATGSRNQVDPNGDLWMSVLEATGQRERSGVVLQGGLRGGSQLRSDGVQREHVGLEAEAGDDPARGRGDHRVVTEPLASRDVGDVHLDERRGAHLHRVHERVGVVGEGTGVQDDRCRVVAGLVYPGDQLALVLGLPDLDGQAEFLAGGDAQVGQIGICRRSVYRWFPLAEAAEVRPVEHEHPAADVAGIARVRVGGHAATAP
jgi:6-phosphofructokinase 1